MGEYEVPDQFGQVEVTGSDAVIYWERKDGLVRLFGPYPCGDGPWRV